MKNELIEEIKNLILTNKEENPIQINPNYLNYFDEEELLDIKEKLLTKKINISKDTSEFVDKIYEKTKKDEI